MNFSKDLNLTMVERIFSEKMQTEICTGDRIEIMPDQILANEMLGAVVLPKMEEIGVRTINPNFPKEAFKCFLDHGGIGATSLYVEMHQKIRKFCKANSLNYYEPGMGIGHICMAEIGATSPGDIILGTDSHTTTQGGLNTYAQGIGASDLLEILLKAQTWLIVPSSIKFFLKGKLPPSSSAKDVALAILKEYGLSFSVGQVIEYECPLNFSIASRQTMANLSAEMGATSAIFQYDLTLEDYLSSIKLERRPRPTRMGKDEIYTQIEELNLESIIPYVAKPHKPNNVVPAAELSDIIPNQVYIGSCTNSRIDDLREVAKVLKGRKTKILTLISPGSHAIMLQAEKEGLIKIFLDAGCRVIYPGCNACFGGPVGLIGKEMTCLSTTNRNFEGRMGGDATSSVYLSSPATAAASAVTGMITDPRDIT